LATANLYIQQLAPWTLAKEGRNAELDVALHALARTLYRLAVLAEPFIPAKAASIREGLGVSPVAGAAWDTLAAPPVEGAVTSRPETLFPKPSRV
jgi:methionyl-tRNA synthetase